MFSKVTFGGSLFFWESKRKVKGSYETLTSQIAKSPSGTLYVAMGTSLEARTSVIKQQQE